MNKRIPVLEIAPLSVEKLEYLQLWLNSKDVHKYLYTLYRPMSLDELINWHKKENAEGSHMFFYSADKTDHKPAGIGLVHYIHSKNRCGELSIIINPELFGKGLGTQILQHLMLTGFNALKLHKLFAHAVEFNKRSIALLEKMKFIQEAVYRKELYWSKDYYDIYRYGMLEDEYFCSGQNSDL